MQTTNETRKVRIYVAGSWAHRVEIRDFQKVLLDRIPNMQLTHDWTFAEDIVWEQRTTEFNRKHAELDLYTGVGTADAVVAIFTNPELAYRGTYEEIGFALGRGLPVFVFSPHMHNKECYVTKNIFHCDLGDGQQTLFDNFDDLVDCIIHEFKL